MNRCGLWMVIVSGLALSAGCAQGLDAPAYQTRTIEGAKADAVYAAAEVILKREFGRVTVEPDAGRIVSVPHEYTTDRDSGTARDLVRGRSVMRKVATFNVRQRGTATVARLRIDVERKDTAQRTAVQPVAGRISDSPAYTPIERDAATTKEQNAVWTKARRDRRLERALLDELRELFAPDQGDVAAGAGDESPAP